MKKREDLMPTTRMLFFLSWVILAFALPGVILLIMSRYGGTWSLLRGAFIFIAALATAMAMRMLGNIGQILFDTRKDMNRALNDLNTRINEVNTCLVLSAQSLRELNEAIQRSPESLKYTLEQIHHNSKDINQDVGKIRIFSEQINCDSKDINQAIDKIKAFFEQIERHLDLKK
ncbi:MAG: hypothetical protein WC510_08140 [Candidatus Omnitrophota bacterium]